MTVAAIIVGLAILGSIVALIAWLAHGWIAAEEKLGAQAVKVATLTSAIDERDRVMDDLRQNAQRESVARAVVEKQRDDLLHALAGTGDPHAIAAGIRSQLQALSGSPAAQGGGGEGAVHAATAARPIP